MDNTFNKQDLLELIQSLTLFAEKSKEIEKEVSEISILIKGDPFKEKASLLLRVNTLESLTKGLKADLRDKIKPEIDTINKMLQSSIKDNGYSEDKLKNTLLEINKKLDTIDSHNNRLTELEFFMKDHVSIIKKLMALVPIISLLISIAMPIIVKLVF